MTETDHERQLKLVFGDGAVPANFLSHTDSHAFDGCHAGLVYRYILVYDLNAGVLYGYAWSNWLNVRQPFGRIRDMIAQRKRMSNTISARRGGGRQ